MRYNQLGNTGLFVSEICLGTMTFGSAEGAFWGGIAGVDQDAADRIVERSLAAGVNFIDTADVYSAGESERLLGQSLINLGVERKDVVIATKVFGQMGNGPNDRGASRGHIMDSVEESLDRLQMDHIDLYQIHGTDTVTPIDETLRALDDLVSGGLVRYVGMSNWQAWRIAKALGVSERKGFARFETLQAYYSIAGRDLERDIVPLLNEEKMGLMVWSPHRAMAKAAGQASIFRLLTRTGPGPASPPCARLRKSMVPVSPKWRSLLSWPSLSSPASSSAPSGWNSWRKT
jgi:aryl-alcohol dehydrogenase-like predicted oxidoreductase